MLSKLYQKWKEFRMKHNRQLIEFGQFVSSIDKNSAEEITLSVHFDDGKTQWQSLYCKEQNWAFLARYNFNDNKFYTFCFISLSTINEAITTSKKEVIHAVTDALPGVAQVLPNVMLESSLVPEEVKKSLIFHMQLFKDYAGKTDDALSSISV